jgi:hypothetical protein
VSSGRSGKDVGVLLADSGTKAGGSMSGAGVIIERHGRSDDRCIERVQIEVSIRQPC